MIPRNPTSLWPDPDHLGPLTDLYQLSMMAGYQATGLARQRATFEAFVRRLPAGRSYLVFSGLEQAIADLLRLAFSREQVDAIRRLPVFGHIEPAFFDRLLDFRFQGDVWAIPEGTVVFPGEPVLRIEADLDQAQLAESYLLAALAYPTSVASKASRIVQAAENRPLIDFGFRRGHGPSAGMLAARASYLAGFAGTSLVEASTRLGIPCSGTMAHSWVQAFDDERDAFSAFARLFPGQTTLLVDTRDTLQAVRWAAAIEPPIAAIRIDSGDLLHLSIESRKLLDELGRPGVKIVVSGDLDEWSIRKLVQARAPIDVFGVGTELITSRDAPALSLVYKLVALAGKGKIKLSPGKSTYPLAKQVHRTRDPDGRFSGDLVTVHDELADGEPLLRPVVRDGQWLEHPPDLEAIRAHCLQQQADLPGDLRRLEAEATYPVAYSHRLKKEAAGLGAS